MRQFEANVYRYVGARAYQSRTEVIQRLHEEGMDEALLYLVAAAGEVYLRHAG